MNSGQDYLLIVEDDRDILRLLDAALTFKGYRVILAHNGREALEIIQIKRPQIIITDIMMPQLDGFGLVHRLRIQPETCDIPVIFITATFVAPEDRDFALNIGATRFIQKPVDLEKFLSTIEELLQQETPPAVEPLKEVLFYEGYRRRLEIKLDQKLKQIAREEHLLGTRSKADDPYLQGSLRQSIRERDELRLLLFQVYEQLEKYNGTN
jgi:two-component system cell cycle sensor histidine kinase/response regulator CckA